MSLQNRKKYAELARAQQAIITVVFALIHGALLMHGYYNPGSFLAGDRSIERLEKIAYVFDLNDVAEAFSRDDMLLRVQGEESALARVMDSGHPGDYFIHGFFLDVGGVNAVVLFQLFLLLLSIYCVYLMVVSLGRTHRLAMVAAILYLLLPGNLIYPHELTSEAIYNPLVVFGFFFIIKYIEDKSHYLTVVTGLLFLSMAMFVRPQLSLYPFVLLLVLAVHYRRLLHPKALAVLPVCFLLPFVWSLFVFHGTGEFSVGSKEYGPEVAFFKTAQRMSVIDEYDFNESTHSITTMSIGEFISQLAEHPTSFFKLKATEAFNLVFNPGVYSVAGHHLNLLSGGGDTNFWKQLRDQSGISGVLNEVMQRSSATSLIVLVGAIVWGTILLVAVAGGARILSDNRSTGISKVILISYLFYGLFIVLVSGEGRWAHRTSVEFVLVIFFAAGIELGSRRQSQLKSADTV